MYKDALHGLETQWEHRHLHNLYGFYYVCSMEHFSKDFFKRS